MIMNKFTKGPWTIRGRGHAGNGADIIIGADKNYVAQTGQWSPQYKAEQRANAHLIAASPTMFEYIKSKADSGDTEASKIISEIVLDS
jgi:hypothetical protein